jgi:predicted nuclease of restriction endonuclease-like RecB superfamily
LLLFVFILVMLTREQAIAEFDFNRGIVIPDRLTTNAHRQYATHAERMLEIYRRGVGQTRRALHQSVRTVFYDEPDCPQRRIAAFCKLLDDASSYHRCPPAEAAALRRDVYRAAASLHPLVEQPDVIHKHTAAEARQIISAQLARPWHEVERDLFGDVIDFHRLEQFDGDESATALLSRYNVAQQQAALYDATSMTVWAGSDLKTIVRYAKLAKLMHRISREPDGRYVFHFDGPASVLRSTSRYGAALARFLPALLACEDWRMQASVQRSRRRLTLALSSSDGYKSHLPKALEFDSSVEESFAAKWGPEPRDGWTLVREGDVLWSGQRAFVPDFGLRHEDGRRVLLEIVGFWTPEYLRAKLDTLQRFRDAPILVAVAARHQEHLGELPSNAIVYKSKLKVKDVLERLNRKMKDEG